MHKISGFSVKRILKRHGLLLFLLLYIGALTVPYIPHKKVSASFKKQFAEREFYSSSVGTERAAYIPDNTDALLYRLHMINSAQKEIILSTFDFNADKAGKDVMAALYHAAERGVKVRVIVDGFSGLLDMKLQSPEWFQALAAHENIQVKVYNPINLLKPWDMQARLHDKYVIVDEQMYLLGGRNTMNLFLGDYSSSKNIDRELFVYETESNPDASLFQVKTYFENIWGLSDSKDFSFMQSSGIGKQRALDVVCSAPTYVRSGRGNHLHPVYYLRQRNVSGSGFSAGEKYFGGNHYQ